MYFDSGTRIVGAHHELRELRCLFSSEAHQWKLEEFANSEAFIGILFLHTPSVWGTWEAGVLSTKYRLENVGGYSIHVRGTKHSPRPSRSMSEPSPYISFIQWS
jgi:hypothetical protein